jgi:hypothetical protein
MSEYVDMGVFGSLDLESNIVSYRKIPRAHVLCAEAAAAGKEIPEDCPLPEWEERSVKTLDEIRKETGGNHALANGKHGI